jgi:hypothetical protein
MNLISPPPLDSVILNWEVKTTGMSGSSDVQVSVNSIQVPEKYFFNDRISLSRYLNVTKDSRPPILDVTVDGRYLVNGDVVSANPSIQIKIIDESSFYFKTDTLGIEIAFYNKDSNTTRRINFSNPLVHWTPASAYSDFNISFVIELEPGEYELSVQGNDASGNPAGQTPYVVSFIVTKDSEIRIGNPYPNPSYSSFSFPIRISGNELPGSFSLKIFAPDGRLIRHFNLPDVHPFYIGTNTFRWDATDFNGDPLPTAVYYFSFELYLSKNVYSKTGSMLLIRP